ncbi:hypothetical protein ACN24K_30155 [Streptomyces microflavus]
MVEQQAMGGVLDGHELAGEPPFEEEELAVDAGKNAGVHQEIPKRGGRSPAGGFLKALVGERTTACPQILENLGSAWTAKPEQVVAGAVGVSERFGNRQEARGYLPVAAAEEVVDVVGKGAALAVPAP